MLYLIQYYGWYKLKQVMFNVIYWLFSDPAKLSGGVIAGAVVGGIGVIIVILGAALAIIVMIKIKKRQQIRYKCISYPAYLHV